MSGTARGRPGKALLGGLLAALAASTLLSCGPRTPVQKAGEDQEIARDISWELRKDPRLEDVSVSCVDGVVTLSGRVDGQADSEKALDLAESWGRGAQVVNRLEIRPR